MEHILLIDVKETLEVLTETHFPGRLLSNQIDEDIDEYRSSSNRPVCNDMISVEHIKWAIKSFKPYKSPGVDGIFPALLQEAVDLVSKILCVFYKFSLKSGYIPKDWRRGKIVFIPKVGNRPNDIPKSFRPITLSSFLLKTMELLIDRNLKDTYLRISPLHPRQFAYQEGKSTTKAAKSTVKQIQKTMNNGKIVVGLSIDIEGAFDNTNYNVILRGLRRKQVDESVINWIDNMLRCSTELAGESILFKPVKGCPQGEILSPLLWTIVVDEVLVILNDGGFKTDGFADDFSF